MSQVLLCRLCLGNDELIYMFDSRLSNAQQLRMCVLLCTGVEIKYTDDVSKMVCHNCCSIAVKIFKFRKSAVANDRALKELDGQPYVVPVSCKEDLAKLHNDITYSISQFRVCDSVEKFHDGTSNKRSIEREAFIAETNRATVKSRDTEVCQSITNEISPRLAVPEGEAKEDNSENCETSNILPNNTDNEGVLSQRVRAATPDSLHSEYATSFDMFPSKLRKQCIENVHPSIKQLFGDYPDIVIPNELLNYDIYPTVPIDKSESNKYLYQLDHVNFDSEEYDTEEFHSFKTKFPSINVVNVKPSLRKNRTYNRNGEQQIYGNVNALHYFTDSDSSERIFKSRKRKYADESDRSYSDSDSESDLETEHHKSSLSLELSTRSSRNKIAKINYHTDSDSDYDFLGYRKTEGKLYYCEYCDRVCYSRAQLRNHERTHRKCMICHRAYRTQEQLDAHTRKVCYRNVQFNQPLVLLSRVDEDLFIVEKHQDAFDYFFSKIYDEDFEGFGWEEDEFEEAPKPVRDVNFPLYHTEEHIKNETEHITKVFEKCRNIKNLNKNKIIQTRTPDTVVKYSNQNQLILQDMYTEILMYKVPIQMIVDQKISAHMSFTVRPSQNSSTYNWSDLTPIDVVGKPKILNAFLPPPVLCYYNQKQNVVKSVTSKAAPLVHARTTKSVTRPVVKNIPNLVSKSIPNLASKVLTTLATKTGNNLSANNRPKIYNIRDILTTVTTNSKSQVYTLPKTVMNVTHHIPQTNTITKEDVRSGINRNIINKFIVTQSTMASQLNRVNDVTNRKPSDQNLTMGTYNVPIKEELPSDVPEKPPTLVYQPRPPTISKGSTNMPRNIVFRFPISQVTQNRPEPPTNPTIKEELPSDETVHMNVNSQPTNLQNITINNSHQNLVFKIPFNPNIQSQHQQSSSSLYQQLTSNVNSQVQSNNSNVYLSHALRNNLGQHKNQYVIPLTPINSQNSPSTDQNGFQFRNTPNVKNLLLLKNRPIQNSVPIQNAVATNINQAPSNGNSYYSCPSPINSVSSPINPVPSPISAVPSPVNAVPSPTNSIPSPVSTDPYTANAYPPINSYPVNSNPFTTDTFQPASNSSNSYPSSLDSVSYTSNSFPTIDTVTYTTNSYTPTNSDPYSTNSFPSSDTYNTNSYSSDSYIPNSYSSLNTDAYTPNSYPSTAYTPPQYIPPYNTPHISEYGSYNETNNVHNIQSQHMTPSGGNKAFLRVKQPWELV